MMRIKVTTLFLIFFTVSILGINIVQGATSNVVTPKAPYVSNSIKSGIAKYKQKNYVGAMQDLEAVLAKEPKNMTGLYYLALTYTQLGYQDKAKQIYQIIVDSNKNSVLAHYSQYALDCIGNSTSEQCSGKKTTNTNTKAKEDDITQFIKSGVQIHPAAMDKITNERMIRKIQAEEYLRKQQTQNNLNTNLKSDNSIPSNDEIVAALGTLAKIGYNPLKVPTLEYNYLESSDLYGYPDNISISNPEYFKLLMFNQMTQQNNLVNNYGI